MHAAYTFLMDRDMLVDRDINSVFEELYGSPYCDENNWYQLMMAVDDQGELVALAPEDDYRGRNYMQEEWLEIPQQERYKKALRFSLDVVAVDMELYGQPSITLGEEEPSKISQMELEDLLHDITTVIPMRLSEGYGARMGMKGGPQFDYELYRLTKLSEQYATFSESISKDTWFADPVTPYKSYRAIDLRPWRNEEEKQQMEEKGTNRKVILFVDIHT